MRLLYGFDIDTPSELLAILAENLQRYRLEKRLSREALYNTMEELEMINKNKNRKKGRNEIGK